MKFGASMFFTDYSMTPTELALALEQRGFDIMWAPEHSHIPLSRKTPFVLGGDLPKRYYDVMDPFVTLSMASAVTKTLKLGTGVCLIAQRDPIQTAKLVASIDVVSNGRFVFGVGNGWNQDEMENHGTVFASRHKLARERIEAMKAIWTQDTAEYHGEFVTEATPPDPHRRRLPLQRPPCRALRRWLDAADHRRVPHAADRADTPLPPDGSRSRPRPDGVRHLHRWPVRGPRPVQTLSGPEGEPRLRQPALGKSRHDPARSRPLGGDHARGERIAITLSLRAKRSNLVRRRFASSTLPVRSASSLPTPGTASPAHQIASPRAVPAHLQLHW
jgi:probable F420-dependent oxidoreductase